MLNRQNEAKLEIHSFLGPVLTTTIVCSLALSAMLPIAARAEDSGIPEKGFDDSHWHLTLKPYVWAAGIKGTAGAGSLSVPVDVKFTDLLTTKILESIQFAGMMEFEAQKGRCGILVDGVGVRLNDDNITAPMLTVIDATVSMAVIDVGGFYRIYRSPSGYVDLLAGARYMHMGVSLDGTPQTAAIDSASVTVVDKATTAIGAQVGDAVSGKASDIASSAVKSRGDIGQVTADLIKQEVKPVIIDYVSGLVGSVGGVIAKGVDVLDPQINLGGQLINAIADKVQAALDQHPVANHLAPAAVEKIITDAATSAINDLKKTASSTVRKALDQAQQQLQSTVHEGMTKAANASVSAGKDWVDAYVGARARWDITRTYYLVVRGDIAGFSNSHRAWQLFGGAGAHLSKRWSLEAGYRYMHFECEDGSVFFNGAFAGATVGMGVEL